MLSATTAGDAVAGALVLGYGVVAHRALPRELEVPASIVASAAAIAIARAHGISWSELGLDLEHAGRGALVGSAVAAPIAAGIIVASRSSRGRGYLRDRRVSEASRREAAYHLAVRIPLATVVLEEVIFRGTLLARLRRHRTTAVAVIATAAVFGVWHLLPALEAVEAQEHHHVAIWREPASAVGATIGVTALAGIGLAALRLRSRSLLAPVIVHAALNVGAYAATRRIAAAAG
jgi:membrane protease YdiL (CAAX protease family)